MSIRTRLVGGFVGIALIALAIGLIGYVNIGRILANQREMADNRLIGVHEPQVISQAQTAIDGEEHQLLAENSSPEDVAGAMEEFDGIEKRFTDAWALYVTLPQSDEEAKEWSVFVPAWETWWRAHLTYVGLAKEYWNARTAGQSMEDAAPLYDRVSGYGLKTMALPFAAAQSGLERVLQVNYGAAMALRASSFDAGRAAQTAMAIVIAVGLALAIGLGLAIANGITRPLGKVVEVGRMVAKGELPSSAARRSARDEIGVLSEVFDAIVESLRGKLEEAARIAGGDMSIEVRHGSANDAFASAFEGMTGSLNDLLGQVTVAVTQVSSGAGQVSAASQSVRETTAMVDASLLSIAEGATLTEATAVQLSEILEGARKTASLVGEITAASEEQAEALSQISSGLEDMEHVTQTNAASAEECASAAEELSSQAAQLRDTIGRFRLKGGPLAHDTGHDSDDAHAAPDLAAARHGTLRIAGSGTPAGLRLIGARRQPTSPRAAPTESERALETLHEGPGTVGAVPSLDARATVPL